MVAADAFLKKIYNYSIHERLPSSAKLTVLANKVFNVLVFGETAYRPNVFETDVPGGLLDFRKQQEKPCIVVPDIHARPEFIFNILNFVLPKNISGLQNDIRIADALDNDQIFVVCVGDILHAEGRAGERWLLAYQEFISGDYAGPNMKEEMREGLGAEMAVMECKCRWPKNFHCLKGNHENIKNEYGGGNYPFRKFANEGEMVFCFMLEQYDPDVLEVIYRFEKILPLAFCTNNLFVSHAEPLLALSEKDIVNGRRRSESENVVFALTWTANDEAQEGSVKKMLSSFCKPKDKSIAPIYIGGHRPVKGKFYLRQNGLYVQIHNPLEQNIAVVRADKTFNPETQIISVEK